MNDLLALALNRAQLLGAAYADVRTLTAREQSVSVRNGVVEGVGELENAGFGVRVLVNDAWGFASSAIVTAKEVERITAEAIAIAKASASYQQRRVYLGPPEVHQAVYRTPVEIDPFTVSIEDKIALLLEADRLMRAEASVKVAQGNLVCLRKHQTFASTEGSTIEQEIFETGGAIMALAIANGEIQRRSYPNVFRDQHAEGWEFIQRLDFVGNAPRIGAEAAALLSAEQCPNQVTTLILDRTQLGLQIHESCGHPTELDRVFGTEAAYAGTSFLTPEKLGVFRYGSEIVNLTADATTPGGLGTFGYDDEGVPAQRVPLVREGLFVGYLSSRETATQLAQLRGEDPSLSRSGGAMRASGWNRIPIIRMTNINLEPGTWELEDLIADTDEGIYMETNKSWSIDNLRLNFLFGTELAYEIKGGKRGKLYKNATYTGMTPEFWGACDAICNANSWGLWGVPNCGKGQPSQTAHAGHGAAPARFRNVRVGVMK
ncbi:MAG: protease TldD [Chloroflexi bacterium ADurb.Bin360]|nr:MAG: protease TldD [Chloroflexi bacterium ADurb.Bin360]